MTEHIIVCPHCKKEIPLTEAISHQIREQLQQELSADAEGKRQELLAKEKAIEKRQKELDSKAESVEAFVQETLRQERDKLKASIEKKVKEESSLEVKDLQASLAEKDNKLEEAQKAELELRKRAREVEDRGKNLDLEVARKLDEQKEQVRTEVLKKTEEEYSLKLAEKDKQIQDAAKANEDLRRKLQQGSQQTQGEVLELELEALLAAAFPHDQIEPVPKGMRGADLLQKVYNPLGQQCGSIIWESKRTKTWSDQWLQKIKDDQREVKANIAVIVSIAVPRDFRNFALLDAVWVTEYDCTLSLAHALRINLIELSVARLAATGKQEKVEILYNYLSGPEFKQRVEGIVEAFLSLQQDLEKEKRAMTKIWAQREKQIQRVIRNTTGMYGDMQGIIGSALPQIQSLELKVLDAPINSETEESPDTSIP